MKTHITSTFATWCLKSRVVCNGLLVLTTADTHGTEFEWYNKILLVLVQLFIFNYFWLYGFDNNIGVVGQPNGVLAAADPKLKNSTHGFSEIHFRSRAFLVIYLVIL
jgi:hypothetical protein